MLKLSRFWSAFFSAAGALSIIAVAYGASLRSATPNHDISNSKAEPGLSNSVSNPAGAVSAGPLALPLPGETVVIGFDQDAAGVDIPDRALIGEQYASIGVHFNPAAFRTRRRLSACYPDYFQRPSLNFLSTWTAADANPAQCPNPIGGQNARLVATFDYAVEFVSIEGYTRTDADPNLPPGAPSSDTDRLIIQAFDVNGSLLGSGNATCSNQLNPNPPPAYHEGICVPSVSMPGIRRVEVPPIDLIDALDTLTFRLAPVTDTPTATATATSTSTNTPTATSTNTATDTPTSTPTNTATATATNTSTPTSTHTATNTATATTTPTQTSTSTPTSTPTPTATSAPPDLVIVKSDGQDTVQAGDTLTYTLTISNVGGQTATGVAVTDTLPAQTTFVAASDGGSELNGLVTWPTFDLAAGASATRTVTVRVNDSTSAPERDTRSWADPGDGDPDITFSTPEHYSGCRSGTMMTNIATVTDDGAHGPDPTPENNRASDTDGVTASDVIWTTGVPDDWTLKGWARVEYVVDTQRILIREYQISQTGDLDLRLAYPPVGEWPVMSNGVAEIHVDLAIEVYDDKGQLARWVGDDRRRAPGTLGPGQDWDVWCRVANR